MEFKVILDNISLKKALRLLYRKRLIITGIVDTVIILYGIGIIVVSQVNKNYPIYHGIIILLLGLIGFIIRIIKMNKNIDLSIKQLQQSFDGNSCDFLYVFSDDDITYKNLKSGNTSSIKYSDFKRCIENNDIILLITNLKQSIFIPKNSLDDLTCKNIVNLLKDKNIAHKRVK